MKARSHPNRVRLSFTDVERVTLISLLDDLGRALQPDGLQPGDPVHDRLYPAGYSPAALPDAQQEFRDLTYDGLREQRLERVATCRDELSAAGHDGGRVDVNADGCDRWLRVLNDLRLSIGTRLGISEDDDHWSVDPAQPDGAAYVLYGWLTEMQDTVVRIATG